MSDDKMPRKLTDDELERCRKFFTRPDLCTKGAILEWAEALLDHALITQFELVEPSESELKPGDRVRHETEGAGRTFRGIKRGGLRAAYERDLDGGTDVTYHFVGYVTD